MIGLPERVVFSVFTRFGDICRVFKICTLMTFNFAPTDYSFTSAIPDVFKVSDFQGETLIMRIYLNRSTNPIFETTLYVYNNKAEIYDLRSVIEDYMEVHGMPYADCSIGLQVDRTDYSIPEFKLFYCRYAISGSCKDWLQSHFATNHAVRLVPRDFFLDLQFYVFPNEQGKCSTHLVILPSGGSTPVVYDIGQPTINSAQFNACTIEMDETYFLSLLPKGVSGKLLSVTIQCGARSFSLFISDELPTLRLYYTNEYNYSDVFHLTAQTKRKLAFSRSTAICCGKSSSYDDQTEVEFESESSALTPSEARQLTTALQSSSLFIVSPDYPQGTSILVTDIESELSDASNELCHVKFNWKPVRQQPTLTISKHPRIFSPNYNRTFN